MSRCDPTANSGWVAFPEVGADISNSGEGGMTVHALIYSSSSADPFANNAETALGVLLRGGPVFSADVADPGAELFGDPANSWDSSSADTCASFGLLACVCLGSSGGSFWNERDQQYWAAAREHLTAEGRDLLRNLERLYDRSAVLLTTLDT
jgi:hypothetical protein